MIKKLKQLEYTVKSFNLSITKDFNNNKLIRKIDILSIHTRNLQYIQQYIKDIKYYSDILQSFNMEDSLKGEYISLKKKGLDYLLKGNSESQPELKQKIASKIYDIERQIIDLAEQGIYKNKSEEISSLTQSIRNKMVNLRKDLKLGKFKN